MAIRAEFKVKLPVKLEKKEHMYVSSCPILDVYSQGKTQKEAIHNIIEALKLFLISCFERNALDAVLKESGFTAQKKARPLRKPPGSQRFVNVPIPFDVAPKGNSPSECRV
jgi:predicted RNase H-like HicB family nuclease